MTQTAISPSEPYVHDGPLWLTLGAGEAANYGVGRKAAWLDRAGAAGMRVPTGVIVLDVTYKVLIRNGLLVIDHENNTVSAPEPQDVLTALGLPAFENKINVAVRSAFSAEDTPSLSMAGFFKSVLDIDVTKKPETLVDALCEVYASALEFGPDARRDVMIMQMVGAQHAGVAFTERGYQDDVVNYVTGGTADKLLLGEEEGNSAFIPRLQAFEKATYEEGPFRDKATWKDRLQIVSRRLRGIFNTENLDIEWADDGLSLYLLQVRPVTAPVRRNEAFTIANHKEILPALPSRFMVSVIESCSADLYSYYRQFDSSLPQYRPFIEVFKGRPYINLSLMTETMRALGLPTSLVTDNIGGDDAEQTSGFSIKRATAKLPNLAQLGLAQLNVAASAEATGKEIVKRTHSPGDTLGECVKTLQWTYTTLVREMFALTQAMALPLATLRRIGALEGRAAAHRTIATQIYDDLGPLRAYVAEHPELKPALAEGKLPEDAEFRRRWGLYLAKYGHRGIYESDIARPRYREAPQPLLMSLAKPVGEKRREQPPTARLDSIAGPFWNQASKAMAARELLRHEAIRGFESIRKRLLLLAEATV